MKKQTIITALSLLFSFSCLAVTEAPDTLLYVDPASRLVITESPAGTFVEVTTDKGEKIDESSAEYR